MNTTCTCQVCTQAQSAGTFHSPLYNHGLAEGLPRSEVCECGYWSCITRGCGGCPDCNGEHCECDLLP